MDGTADGHIASMLQEAGIDPTPLRVLVAGTLDAAQGALSAPEVLHRVRRHRRVNRVTVYRILDLFVARGLANRHSAGERALRYCLGGKFSRRPHCHAHCLCCGRTVCLPVAEGLVNLEVLGPDLPLDVTGVELRIDGVCPECAAAARDQGKQASVDASRRKP